MRLMYFVIVGGLALAIGCSGSVEDEDAAGRSHCRRLRDHVIDLRLASAKGVDVEAHRKHMRQALGDEFLVGCAKKLTRKQVDCALAAADSQTAAACSQ